MIQTVKEKGDRATKTRESKQKTNNTMTALNSKITIITLNLNRLNIPIQGNGQNGFKKIRYNYTLPTIILIQ